MTPPLTDADLTAIEERLAKATLGPWTLEIEGDADDPLLISIREIQRSLHDYDWAEAEDWERDLANAEFIAHAREDMPMLLREVRALRARIEKALGHCDAFLSPAMTSDEGRRKVVGMGTNLAAVVADILRGGDQ
jgi:hypothetical protein